MSARKKLFNYIQENKIRFYTYDELKEIAQSNSWTRTLRQLKQDGNIEFDYDPAKKGYHISFVSDSLKDSVRSTINSKLSYKIKHRDFYTCQTCGKTVKDGVKLHVDHRIPVEWGGTNEEDNLWTLCSDCNQGKKSFFKDDFEPALMREIHKQTSAEKRLMVLFERSPNTPFTPTILQSVAGIQDWPRSIRRLREKTNWNIQHVPKTKNNSSSYYINVTEE